MDHRGSKDRRRISGRCIAAGVAGLAVSDLMVRSARRHDGRRRALKRMHRTAKLIHNVASGGRRCLHRRRAYPF